MKQLLRRAFQVTLEIDSWRGHFQQIVRGKYPLLLVPSVNPGDFPALLHYHFSNLHISGKSRRLWFSRSFRATGKPP
jgi:hypothetical protein